MDKNKPPFRGASLSIFHLRAMIFFAKENRFIPKRSLDIGEIARLCHVACFWPGRRRGGLRRGVAGNRMRTEAGKMPGSLIFPIRNGHGVSDDRFGFIGDAKGWCNEESVIDIRELQLRCVFSDLVQPFYEGFVLFRFTEVPQKSLDIRRTNHDVNHTDILVYDLWLITVFFVRLPRAVHFL